MSNFRNTSQYCIVSACALLWFVTTFVVTVSLSVSVASRIDVRSARRRAAASRSTDECIDCAARLEYWRAPSSALLVFPLFEDEPEPAAGADPSDEAQGLRARPIPPAMPQLDERARFSYVELARTCSSKADSNTA